MQVKASFDLAPDGSLCSGVLLFDGQTLTAAVGENIIFTSPLHGGELNIRTYSGCGMLEAVPENPSDDMSDCLAVCRFSMTCVNEIGEFVKVVNHYLRTGKETEISTKDFRVCPKCGSENTLQLRSRDTYKITLRISPDSPGFDKNPFPKTE